MSIQYQLRDKEIIDCDEARYAVLHFMTNSSMFIIAGAHEDCETVSEVIRCLDDGDEFRVICSDCGVQLHLVADDGNTSIMLGGLRSEMDPRCRWVAIPRDEPNYSDD